MKKLLVVMLSMAMTLTSVAPVFAVEGAEAEDQNSAEAAVAEQQAENVETAEEVPEAEEETALEAEENAEATSEETPAAESVKLKKINPVLKKEKKDPSYRPHEAVVLMKASMTSKEVKTELQSVDRSVGVDQSMEVFGENVTYACVTSDLSTEKLIEKLKKDKSVLYAEPNYIYHTLEVTDDTYADRQWGYDRAGVDIERDKGFTGSEKVVAVVDTGVDYNNEDLKNSMWTNTMYPKLKGNHGYDFANVDSRPMDDNGHGSHCAGIIAAERNNGKGIKGVSDAKIMAVKCLGADGSGDLMNFINGYNYIIKAQKLGVNIVAVNNSWGGDGDSEILTEMIDIIGEQGAVSVCAAGNESADNDKVMSFPACCDSPYVLSVASTTYEGKLASYSNWGKDSVDVGAPGTNIWSTVSYDNFTPSIYDAEDTDKLVESFCDFDDGNIPESFRIETINKAGEIKSDNYKTSRVAGTNGESGALRIDFNCEAGDLACIRIPYTSGKDNAKHVAARMRVAGPYEQSGIFCIADYSADSSLVDFWNNVEDEWNKAGAVATYINEDMEDLWRHYEYTEDEADASEKYIYLSVYALGDDEYTMFIDDIGISKDVDSSEFGRYDMYSGTSMATPFMTGAYALKAQEVDDDPLETKAAILSNVDADGNLEVRTRGEINFGRESALPHISGAKLEGENVIISGFGLKDCDVTVDGRAVDTVSTSAGTIVIPNDDLTNKLVTITVTNENGSDTRENIYMVKGKKQFKSAGGDESEDEWDFVEMPDGNIVTGGINAYGISDDSILKTPVDEIKNQEDWETLATVTPSDFGVTEKPEKSKTVTYGVVVGDSIAYMNGRIYFIAGYGETATAEVVTGVVDLGGGWVMEESEERTSLYSGEYKLMSVETKSGNIRVEAKLPKSVVQTEGITLAPYNGKLYACGGYNFADGSGDLTSAVNAYDPRARKWTAGKALPVPCAEGTAIQTGNRLVYLAKVSEQSQPEMYIYNGKNWDTQVIDSLCPPQVMKIDGVKYNLFKAAIGCCRAKGKYAVVVSGIPTEQGDTFTYAITSREFADTGYQYSTKCSYSDVVGFCAGRDFVVRDNEDGGTKFAKVESGKIRLKVSKKGSGKVSKSKYYMPGNRAIVRAKAKKGYYVKSVTVNGKKKAYKTKKRFRKIIASKAITKTTNVKVVFAKKPKK